jgi:RNA polymerase sigma-70 factor (ECF subfamily)
MKERDDLEILRCVGLAQNGDHKAFQELMDRTEKEILGYLLRLCADEDLARDLYQDVMIRAFRSLSTLKQPSSYRWWLRRLAKNVFLDHQRGNRITSEWFDENTTSQCNEDPELQLSVTRTLDGMDPMSARLLWLVDGEGYSYSEVARKMNLSEEAIRCRLYRARKEFKQDFVA